MVKTLKPYARALKYALLKRSAELRSRNTADDGEAYHRQPLTYIIGCGRSGTTILGKTLAEHPDILYFFEPGHLWSTVDPITDTTNLHNVGECKFILDAPHCTAEARRRFHLLFLKSGLHARAELIVEKTPANTARIGYLECLKDDARYVHIVRDGVDVARSIGRLSLDRSYQIAGQPDRSRWWGRNSSKWKALASDGIASGYFPDEVPLLDNYMAKGAYEWLVSLGEVNRWRKHLGSRLLEIHYSQFTTDPRAAIATICEFLAIRNPAGWMDQVVPRISSTRHNDGPPLHLPPGMCEAFNEWQAKYGFTNRAVAAETNHQRHTACAPSNANQMMITA